MFAGCASGEGSVLGEEDAHGGVGVVSPPDDHACGWVEPGCFPGSPERGEAAYGFGVEPPFAAPGEGVAAACEVDGPSVLLCEHLGDELFHVCVVKTWFLVRHIVVRLVGDADVHRLLPHHRGPPVAATGSSRSPLRGTCCDGLRAVVGGF